MAGFTGGFGGGFAMGGGGGAPGFAGGGGDAMGGSAPMTFEVCTSKHHDRMFGLHLLLHIRLCICMCTWQCVGSSSGCSWESKPWCVEIYCRFHSKQDHGLSAELVPLLKDYNHRYGASLFDCWRYAFVCTFLVRFCVSSSLRDTSQWVSVSISITKDCYWRTSINLYIHHARRR